MRTGETRSGARAPSPRAVKVSVTIDSVVLRDVRRTASRAGRNLSAQVTEALARDIHRRRLAELIAEYEAAAGVITEEELAVARKKWRG